MTRKLVFLILFLSHSAYGDVPYYDIVIYGGTTAGVSAAVQAARMGRSVVLIEPSNHLGGMTSSGLGWVDMGNPSAIGGIAREYFHLIWEYYQNHKVWKWEPRKELASSFSVKPPNDRLMGTVEPHVAERLFENLLARYPISIAKNQRLNRKSGVIKEGTRISSIRMESGMKFNGLQFIDASYEGDLMAAAGVSYRVGREANELYGETLNGIRANVNRTGFKKPMDPYVVKGDPTSGILPRIHPSLGGSDGEEDNEVPAYNYRMCLTDVPENRLMIEKPNSYDERNFEIVFRAIEAGVATKSFFKLDLIPNRKTDSNNIGPVSTDLVGMSWSYAEADDLTRAQIARAHEEWQKGLVWTLQNHPRIPDAIKEYYRPWGLPKDEFTDNGHWPYRLYVREARRMISDTVITENTAEKALPVLDSIGLASYYLDSHFTKYFIANDGFLTADGAFYKKLFKPFEISYRAIAPKRQECENLLVPVCLSATHVAYSSIRMEPVFMILGQSAAAASSFAIEYNLPVQDIPYVSLKERLLKDQQVLEWP